MGNLYSSVQQLVGNTPLLALHGIEHAYGLQANLLGKLEFYNAAPDRIPNADATRFVECADGNIRFMIKNVSDEVVAESLQKRMDEFNK